VPARWQAGLSNVSTSSAITWTQSDKQLSSYQAANCGEIIGLFINGLVAERFGYKNTMLACLISMIGLIFIPVFATSGSLVQLLFYYLLAGEYIPPSALHLSFGRDHQTGPDRDSSG
jgi:MFS family permease